MPPVGYEPTISAGERPQNYALDPAATETGNKIRISINITTKHLAEEKWVSGSFVNSFIYDIQ